MDKAELLLRQAANYLYNVGQNHGSPLTPRDREVAKELQEKIDEYMKGRR